MEIYKCKNCGLIVDDIPRWKAGECPKDTEQHRFEVFIDFGK